MSVYQYAAEDDVYQDDYLASLTPNVTCRNETVVETVRRVAGLLLLPGGRWVIDGNSSSWNGTDCVVVPPRAAAEAFELPMGIVGPALAVFFVGAAVAGCVFLLERRRKRLLRVHGEAPVSLTEDNKSFSWRFVLSAYELVQSTCFDCCGVVCTRRLNRIEYLSTRYNDFMGSVFQVFVDLQIHGQERLKWLDAWATLDKDASNSVDEQEFLEYFDVPADAFGRRFFDTFNEDRNGAVPIRDFLTQTWAVCAIDRTCTERAAFRLLSRQAHFEAGVSVLDVKDMEHFLHARYKFRKANAKKKALHIFAYIDTDNSGGISFDEFRDFGRTNLVFLALGHGFQQKMREKLFGQAYWRKQTAKRKGAYTVDRPFHEALDAYARARYGPGAAAPSFWDDFPEVYERCCELLRNEANKNASLKTLHVTMRAKLHGKLIAALEHLTMDARTLEGAFLKWRNRARTATKMRRAVDDMTGANDDEKQLDEEVHRAIVQASDRVTPVHDMINDMRHKNLQTSARKLTRKQQLAAAEAALSGGPASGPTGRMMLQLYDFGS